MQDASATMNNSLYALESYNYDLPAANIAQEPAARRDHSRLLVLRSNDAPFEDRKFADIIDYLHAGDVLVLNDTRVFPARLLGQKDSGGKIELFLLEYPTPALEMPAAQDWRQVQVIGLLKSSKRPRPGANLNFNRDLKGTVAEIRPDGKVIVHLHYRGNLAEVLAVCGRVPLPPYIRRLHGEQDFDQERYQTVFARQTGAVAAPTAGLHLTSALLERIKAKSVAIGLITLHVGYGTFSPVREKDIRNHEIHTEFLEVPPATAALVNATRNAGGRVWAVGTTTVRGLEAAADAAGEVQPYQGDCNLFIYPGYEFKVVDNLITNFHLPKSSLLFLVSALAGREKVLAAYQHAIEQDYRFYSYGDAMAVIRR